MFCFSFSENGFNIVTQNFQKTKNFPFQMLSTFVFDLKVASKPFYKKLRMTNFEFKWSSVFLSKKTFSTSSVKNLENIKKCPFQTLRIFVFELKLA